MSGQRLLAKVFGPCIVLLLLAGVFDLAGGVSGEELEDDLRGFVCGAMSVVCLFQPSGEVATDA